METSVPYLTCSTQSLLFRIALPQHVSVIQGGVMDRFGNSQADAFSGEVCEDKLDAMAKHESGEDKFLEV